ncbi:hypothetical protein AeRB84_002142 [Aphanomyces euteiches]|nr:hypothetical protein AeRB84_002142 [Aphanomyces euteiches]
MSAGDATNESFTLNKYWAASMPAVRAQIHLILNKTSGLFLPLLYAMSLSILHQIHYWCTARLPSLTYHESSKLVDRILQSCPLLVQPYHPTWFLFNGHLQSARVLAEDEDIHPQVQYKRELLDLSDGGVVSLDWATFASAEDQINQPTVLMFHGLAGNSKAKYARVQADKLLDAGFRVVVMNARGCGKTPVRTPKLFCAAYTEDAREAVIHIRQRIGVTVPLIGLGFSLGANILLKYLGEEGSGAQLTAAVSICNPYCFTATYQLLTYSWFHRVVYNSTLGKCLVRFFFEHSNAPETHEDHPDIDLKALRNAKYISDYDDLYTRRIYGYDTVAELYRDASCTPYIKKIAVPTLCISAKDDPVCAAVAIPYLDCKVNPNVLLAVTHGGGHIGLFTGQWKPKMWWSDVALQYCKAIVEMTQEGLVSTNLRAVQENGALSPETTVPATSNLRHRGATVASL